MVAFLGEALIDFIETVDDRMLRSSFVPVVGGCAVNAATSCARLECDVTYIGKISSDAFGQILIDHFESNNINLVQNLTNVDEQTVLAFATLNRDGSATYSFYLEGTTLNALSSDEIVSALQAIEDLHYLHVGSISLALEKSGQQIVKALERLENKPFIFFDPNVRTTVIENEENYKKRIIEVLKMTNMVKLSDEDLNLLFPTLEKDEAVKHLLSLGCDHIVLTKGKNGIRWFTQEGEDFFIEAIDNPIVDTVGAGDTVSGTILAYLEEHAIGPKDPIDATMIKEALDLAVKAAAITTSRKGADPPTKEELLHFAIE